MGWTDYARRAAAVLCLCALLLTFGGVLIGCRHGTSDDPEHPEGVGTLPEGANGYIIGNLSIILPHEFKLFESGDSRWDAAFNDGYAQFYVRKCLPEDTGTSETLFDRMTASEYGELLLYGTYDYDEYEAHNASSAGFFYMTPGESIETTGCFCVYIVKDKASGCFWLIECRFTLEYSPRYIPIFEQYDEYFVLRK